jgi:hypothetical protein
MITPSDKEYAQTKRIMLGTDKMKAEFIPLAEWIDKTYEVQTINIIYDTLDNKTPRVQICFEFEKEKDKFMSHDISYFDKTKQKAIGDKFKEIIEQQALSKKTTSFLNSFKEKQEREYLTENAFVIYGAFEPIAKMEATNKITKELTEEFIRSFNNKDIWTISIGFIVPTFFMFTNDKVKQYDKPEIKKIWTDKFYDFVKPFDEFDYFKREDIQIYLDSKENFDTNYESNWYYYYK